MSFRPLTVPLTAFFALSLSLAASSFAGCATGQKGGELVLTPAYNAYNAGSMEEAYAKSSAVAENLRYPEQTRQEAAYLAGKTGRKLGYRAKAVSFLKQAAASEDKTLRAQALAECGLVQNELEWFKSGAESLLAATLLLSNPEERAIAYYHAGVAQQKLGEWDDARIHLLDALRYTKKPAFIADIRRQLGTTGYTIQIGSFLGQEGALSTARQWAAKTSSQQIAPPRVIKGKNSTGQEMFFVQVGQFSSFGSARQKQDAMGAGQAIIVPLCGQ